MSNLREMSKRVSAVLNEVCREDQDCARVLFRYSGRAMYDRQCIAISGSWLQCQQALGELMFKFASEVITVALEANSTTERLRAAGKRLQLADIVAQLVQFRTDNLGKSDIVMYWPDLPYIEPEQPAGS